MKKFRSFAIITLIAMLPMLHISCQADDIEPQAIPDKNKLRTPIRN